MSCSATKQIPLTQERTLLQKDTIYLNSQRYDSVYVSKDVFQDRSRDTILIREKEEIVRYRLRSDTVERVKLEVIRDSIPYPVEIEVIKEIPRKRTWFDILSYICLGICSSGLLITLLCLLKGFRK